MKQMLIVAVALLGTTSCELWSAKAQQDALTAQMAKQQALNEAKQREQLRKAFQQVYDGSDSVYRTIQSKIELEESQYQDWLQGVAPAQKSTNEFAATIRSHDELKGNVEKLEGEHGALLRWYETTKGNPTNDDNMKLAQSYGSFSQKQQLYMSSYMQLNARAAAQSVKFKQAKSSP